MVFAYFLVVNGGRRTVDEEKGSQKSGREMATSAKGGEKGHEVSDTATAAGPGTS